LDVCWQIFEEISRCVQNSRTTLPGTVNLFKISDLVDDIMMKTRLTKVEFVFAIAHVHFITTFGCFCDLTLTYLTISFVLYFIFHAMETTTHHAAESRTLHAAFLSVHYLIFDHSSQGVHQHWRNSLTIGARINGNRGIRELSSTWTTQCRGWSIIIGTISDTLSLMDICH